EAQRIGWGASGRSGAQAIFGVAAGQDKLQGLVGADDARRIWDMSVEALSLLRDLMDTHAIDCDWRSGQMHVAIKPRQQRELATWTSQLHDDYGYHSVRYLDRLAVRELVASDRYIAGMHDANSGHLHPLKYVRGLAAAAQLAGCTIHENSRVLRHERIGGSVRLVTDAGLLACRQV